MNDQKKMESRKGSEKKKPRIACIYVLLHLLTPTLRTMMRNPNGVSHVYRDASSAWVMSAGDRFPAGSFRSGNDSG